MPGPEVLARADDCVRQCAVVAARQDCRACVDACPQNAIELDPLRIAPNRCDGCRLCVTRCSSGALEEPATARHDLVTAWRQAKIGWSFVITCRSARPLESNVRGTSIRCLTGLVWEQVAIPLMLGTSSVELRRGRCEDCAFAVQVRRAIELIREKLAPLRAELALGDIVEVELPSDAPRSTPHEPTTSRMSRRGLLSPFGSGGSHALTPVTNVIALDRALERAALADPERIWLRGLMARLAAVHANLPRARAAASPTPHPVIDEQRCTLCGVCSSACPSGALAPAERGSAVGLAVTPHRCSGCERCVRACREAAIALQSDGDLRLWAWGRPTQLVRRRRAACAVCGGDEAIPGLDVCSSCRRTRSLTAKAG